MKNLMFLFVMIVSLGFTSCEKDAGPPPPPPPVDTTDTPPPPPDDTTVVPPVDTTTVDYGNDNDGTQPFPKFALKISTPSGGSEQLVHNTVDSIVFTNYTKVYTKTLINNSSTFWSNVTSPYNGNGIAVTYPEAIVSGGDSCNISVYFSNSEFKIGNSEMGIVNISTISEAGAFDGSYLHYSHTDNY